MKGVFKTHIKKYLFCLFFIIAGSIIAVKFGLWGIDAVRSGKIAAAIFSFTFTVIGVFFCFFSILLFNHNKGAYLTIDNNKIDAHFGYGRELHEAISSIKKGFILLTAILFISTILPVFVHADTGPKPSVHVSFENMGSELCYATLLSETASTGPFSVWDGDEEHIELTSDITEDIWRAFVDYKDLDGYHFLQRAVWKVSESKCLTWGYYPPKAFKILLFYPETGSFLVSGVCERYAFDSYFTADVSENSLEIISVQKSYEWQPEILSLVVRILITIAIELLLALLFGFRSRKEVLFIAIVNVVTQIILNILLNIINFKSGQAAFVTGYIMLEIAVFAVEAVIYSVLLRKISEKAKPVWKCVVYALAANAASFVAGMCIAHVIPGIF